MANEEMIKRAAALLDVAQQIKVPISRTKTSN